MRSRFGAVAAITLSLGAAPSLADDRGGAIKPSVTSTPPSFARIFGDHAVLQRDRPVPVWGKAAPDATVNATLGSVSATGRADARGNWRITLPALPAGGPYTLSVTADGATTRLNDIAIGDVYLCGGQSNMEFPVRLSTGAWGGLSDVANPDLRFVNIEKDNAAAPREDLAKPVEWKPVTADTVGEASAVCYYMAQSLQKSHRIPIGFIASDWGGTTIQSWISPTSLRTMPDYRAGSDSVALYAANPVQAMRNEDRRVEQWWNAHDPQAAAQRAWIAPGYDDSAWDTITPKGSWKDAGLAPLMQFDGVVWFRATIMLTAAQAQSAVALQLGPIDSYDTGWVNGARVGGGTIPWAWRVYPTPAGTLKPGRNVIVLRVLSGGNGGGLTGTPGIRGIRLSSGELVPLDPTWRYRIGMRATGLSITPSPWDFPTSLSTLNNGMIAPIAGYGIKGVAWYQGESNGGAPQDYANLLRLLISDWRKSFAQPRLPFLVVQLSSYGSVGMQPVESGWAVVRGAQTDVVRADRDAALIVTVDVGDRTDVHPTQKTVVGERLARAARAIIYGEPVTPGGPEATAVERRGSDLIVKFRYATGGLRTYSSATAIGFEACAAAKCWFALATVEGNSIVLAGANRAGVDRVRYAWADAPYVNLYNGDDLPAAPFEMTVR